LTDIQTVFADAKINGANFDLSGRVLTIYDPTYFPYEQAEIEGHEECYNKIKTLENVHDKRFKGAVQRDVQGVKIYSYDRRGRSTGERSVERAIRENDTSQAFT
jgi:hypothetical protein